MKYFIRNILFAVVVFCATGCIKDDVKSYPAEETGEEIELKLHIKTPDYRMSTRAVDETLISTVDVLVFEDTGSGYGFVYSVSGYAIQSDATGYEFLARLVPTDNAVRLYLVANAAGAVGGITPGATEAAVRTAITMSYGTGGFNGSIPMSAEIALPGGINPTTILDDVALLRSGARIDVQNLATNFELTSVRVFRANNSLQVIPDQVINNAVTTPSIPAGATPTINSQTFNVTGNLFQQQLYIPESAIATEANRTLGATVVVIGGIFENDAAETYYRMDFIPGETPNQQVELFGQVLRNHRYLFRIDEVQASGWSDDEEASVTPSSQIEGSVIVWDESTIYMEFDGVNHFGVSTRNLNLSYPVGSAETISVDTDLDTYTAFWSDASGNTNTSAGSITPGADFEDPDEMFRVEINGAGDLITVTALKNYDESASLPKYLKLVGGRLNILITIDQGAPVYTDRHVNIFNATGTIGSWGNFVPYQGWIAGPAERTGGLGYMLMGTLAAGPQNFGPGRTVDFPGFYLNGLATLSNTMPRNYFDGSDVLYLTYDYSPTDLQVPDIIDWVDSDRSKILVVQYDNGSSNANVMSALGFTTTTYGGQTTTAFSFAAGEAPGFVSSGPFGTVTDAFDYKCRDNTYGTVDAGEADGLGYIPILLSNATSSAGNYVMAVNPARGVIICGDCDIYSNVNGGSAGSYLNLTNTNASTMTINPANPAHVIIGNLFAWIVDTVLVD